MADWVAALWIEPQPFEQQTRSLSLLTESNCVTGTQWRDAGLYWDGVTWQIEWSIEANMNTTGHQCYFDPAVRKIHQQPGRGWLRGDASVYPYVRLAAC